MTPRRIGQLHRLYALLLAGTTILTLSSCSHEYHLEVKTVETGASFRGMSVVDDEVAWITGSMGTVGRTTNGGETWGMRRIPGYDSLDFRSVYAFDAKTAVIAHSGSPARILRTTDGGGAWEVVYTNTDTSAFIDGMDFWDGENGMIYGDPIGGRMLLARTTDGGLSWKDLPEASRPELAEDEYSFAASGTGIRCYGTEKLVVSTGGGAARLLVSEDRGSSWTGHKTPMLQGDPSTGIFSFTFLNGEYVIIVGGDYLRDTLATDHVFLSQDGGLDWKKPEAPTRGYRECVEVVTGNTVIATGPTGTDISYDGGEHWNALHDDPGFHVVRKARSGSLTLLAGGRGRVAVLR